MSTLLLLLGTLSAQFAPPEPAIDAQQIAAWVAELSSKDYTKQRAAVDALVKLGPKAKAAVPDLIKLLASKDVAGEGVVDILAAIGPDAKEAVPALVALAKPKDYNGFYLNKLAVALVKIDGAKPEATRALLLTPGKGHDISLGGSPYLSEYPEKVVPHVVELCGDKDPIVRAKAAALLGQLNVRFERAGPSLLIRAGDGAKGIPAVLEKMLADENVTVRMTAALAISQVAPQLAEKTIPMIVAAMSDEKLFTEVGGHFPMGDVFRLVPEQAAKALIPFFDSANPSSRVWSINSIAVLPVRGQLEVVLKDGKTASAREAAAMALGQNYSGTSPSGPALTAALADKEFIVRFAAAQGLVNIGQRGSAPVAAAVPVLIEGLKRDSEQVRVTASQYLIGVGEPAKAAVPDLKRLLGDKKPEVALEAALALTQISRSDAVDAVPVLIEGLKTAGDHMASRVIKALGLLGPVAKAAMPEVARKFDAKNLRLRVAAAEVAIRIAPDQAEKATAVMLAVAKEAKSNADKAAAIAALARTGSLAKSAVPDLLAMFKENENKKGRFRADLALAVIAIDAPSAEPAFAWIRDRLNDKDDEDDVEDILNRIQALGPAAKPLVPELRALLKSKMPSIRENCVEALGAIGPDAKDALPQLKEIAEKDQQQDIRKLAAEAIKKIEGK